MGKHITHIPLLQFGLLASRDTEGKILNTELQIFIDTYEDDLQRTVKEQKLKNSHAYNLSLEFRGFDKYIEPSDIERRISGQVYLVANPINTNDSNYTSKKILLAEPLLIVNPVKKQKGKELFWIDPGEVFLEVRSNWLEAFNEALSSYMVQVHSLFNGKSIKAAYSSSDAITPNASHSIKTENNSGFISTIKSRKWTYILGGYLMLATVTGIGGIYLFTTSKSEMNAQQPLNANSNSPTLTVEEAKKAQLRELGINPDDLAADMGCFVEQ